MSTKLKENVRLPVSRVKEHHKSGQFYSSIHQSRKEKGCKHLL